MPLSLSIPDQEYHMFKAIGSLFRSMNNLAVGLENATEIVPVITEGFRDEQIAINQINALERAKKIEEAKSKTLAKVNKPKQAQLEA